MPGGAPARKKTPARARHENASTAYGLRLAADARGAMSVGHDSVVSSVALTRLIVPASLAWRAMQCGTPAAMKEAATVPFDWDAVPRGSGIGELGAWRGFRGLPGDVAREVIL